MASVLAKKVVWPGGKRRLLPGVRPITTLLATGILWITGLMLACGFAAGYLRQEVLNTTAEELRRLDTALVEAATRSLQGVDPTLESLTDRLRKQGDGTAAGFRADAIAPEAAVQLQQALARSPQFDAMALVGADGKVLRAIGRWPTNLSDIGTNKYFDESADSSGSARLVGPPIGDAKAGNLRLPLARRIVADQGAPLGTVVGLLPVASLTAMFEPIPLAKDTVITLLAADGRVLARYPKQPGALDTSVADLDLRLILAAGGVTTMREISSDHEPWRLEAIRPLADYPLAVSVSRGAAATLADWTRQVYVVSFLAITGSLAIALMIYLISRQIRAHDELVGVRAEKLEAERARLEAETKLLKVERLAVLGQVTGAVAHELHVPLTALREGLASLREAIADTGSELERPIARMERSIERCERMSSDLLEYTRTREMQPTTTGFDQWLGEVMAQQEIPSPFKLSTELRAGNAVASFDPDRILRLLIDLVENACQAMDDLPPNYEKRITVRTGVAPGMVVLTVIDTGPGIPPENHAHIFEPLFSTKSYGTGLGLSIVKQIVDQHGGIIRVDSEVGHGTRVRVCLPLAAEVISPELRAAA